MTTTLVGRVEGYIRRIGTFKTAQAAAAGAALLGYLDPDEARTLYRDREVWRDSQTVYVLHEGED